MKKKTIILTAIGILSLIIIAVTLFLVLGKERVNVKIVELPKTVGEFELRNNSELFIETTEQMGETLAWNYILKTDREADGVLDKLKEEKIFSKYNKNFFEENFLFFIATSSEYSGYLDSIPNIEKKKSYISKNSSLVIEVEIINEPKLNPTDFDNVAHTVTYFPTNPHGFLIEIPREEFEKYNMTYDDIEIVYLNSHDTRYNVQYGGDKFRLDPDYPQPIGFDYSKLKDN